MVLSSLGQVGSNIVPAIRNDLCSIRHEMRGKGAVQSCFVLLLGKKTPIG